jgi:hypothetical protein
LFLFLLPHRDLDTSCPNPIHCRVTFNGLASKFFLMCLQKEALALKIEG